MCEYGDWFLLHDNALLHYTTIVRQFLAQQRATVLNHPLYSPVLAPADYFLFPKVKSHLKGCLYDAISDIQTAVTSTLNTTAKDDFYKGIQKLYDHANLCVQLHGIYVKKLNNNSVISSMQILFIMPVIKLSRRTVYVYIQRELCIFKLH